MRILLGFFALVSILFFSCNVNFIEDDLIGTWNATNFDANIPNLSPGIIEEVKTEVLSSSYEFKEGNTFMLRTSSLPNGITGDYQLNLQTMILKLTSVQFGETVLEKYKLEPVSSKYMKWSQDLGEMGSTTIFLSRQD